jgi:hypothetical protein
MRWLGRDGLKPLNTIIAIYCKKTNPKALYERSPTPASRQLVELRRLRDSDCENVIIVDVADREQLAQGFAHQRLLLGTLASRKRSLLALGA